MRRGVSEGLRGGYRRGTERRKRRTRRQKKKTLVERKERRRKMGLEGQMRSNRGKRDVQ